MVEQLVGNIETYVHANPWLALVAVFVGGVLTASNPCVIAMIPLMMSFVAGRKEEHFGTLRAFFYSLVFIVGLCITFVALGMVAALTGSLYGEVSGAWRWIVAVVCLVMGLHLLGALEFTVPVPVKVQPKTQGVLGALIMGLLFGFVSAPCAGPILIVLLTYLATANASASYGAVLLFVYALGHSVMILIAGTSMGLARGILESRKITRATELLRKGGGGVIILVGAYFVYLALKP
ncbi:MAG: sulfite exporter TauE/SafE family protein [Candidatus Riflebacteria bacterium]|nr:sulfite exporter TauE/SafE family protein [Candidatus Riflebacteria bacterium]